MKSRTLDSLLNLADRCLQQGDPLKALSCLGARLDPHGCALRGIALAQLQEFDPAASHLRKALEASDDKEMSPGFRARARLALAEVEIARRNFDQAETELAQAREELEPQQDVNNATWSHVISSRIATLTGDVKRARQSIDEARKLLKAASCNPSGREFHRGAVELGQAEVLSREGHPNRARVAIRKAGRLSGKTEHPILRGTLTRQKKELETPIARLHCEGSRYSLRPEDVEDLRRRRRFVPSPGPSEVSVSLLDLPRKLWLPATGDEIDFGRKPVLFELLRTLTRSWPKPVSRNALVESTFRETRANDSHFSRLRMDLVRLRKALVDSARIGAGVGGWKIEGRRGEKLAVLAPVNSSAENVLLILLSDGQAWSSRNLAKASGASERSVVRNLNGLVESGRVLTTGRGPRRRYTHRPSKKKIPPQLLLLALLDPR